MTPLLERVRSGEALDDILMVDAHAHMGRWHAFHVPRGDAPDMIGTMDRIGCRACISSHHAAIGPDYIMGNEEVERAAAAFPGRIFGYIVANPNYPEQEMREELERRWATGHFVGLKVHADVHKYPTDGPRNAIVWQFAHDHGLPLLSHDSVAHFEEPVKKYTQAKLLIAHAISSPEHMEAGMALAARYSNVYLDICGSPLVFGALEAAVEKVGAERILFGTDLPFLDPRPQVGRVAFAKISEADKLRILGENAVSLFRLEQKLASRAYRPRG